MTNFDMNDIIRHLVELGLTEKEARVYAALVALGSATAYKIAKEAGLKRPTTYVLLDELRKKGVVGKIPNPKNQIFTAKDPTELFSAYERRLQKARRALPALLASQKRLSIETRIFEGQDEISKALEYKRGELANQDMYAFYGVPTVGRKIPAPYYEHANELKQQGTHVKAIASDDKSLKDFKKKDKDYDQDALYLPNKEYSPKVSVEVAAGIVKIYLHGVTQVLVVENKEFCQAA